MRSLSTMCHDVWSRHSSRRKKFLLFFSLPLLGIILYPDVMNINKFTTINTENKLRKQIQASDSRPCVLKNETAMKERTGNIAFGTDIPKVVYQILWTDKLTFRNYLSILSVSKILNPYVIVLYASRGFIAREFDYNDWEAKAVSSIPTLQVKQLEIYDKFKHFNWGEITTALSILGHTGGIYVNIDTVITTDIWHRTSPTYQAAMADNLSLGFLILPRSLDRVKNTSVCRCVSVKEFTMDGMCSKIQEDIFPVDIMRDKSLFAVFARKLFYGSPQLPVPQATFEPIPKFIHYIWLGPKDITYDFFLSFLSTQKFVKPLKIFIYTDTNTEAVRPYFDIMKTYLNVEILYYGQLDTVYQNQVQKRHHASDIIRADVLLRQGGIYLDWDVYWLKPIDDLLFAGYETIATLDFYKDMYPRQEFPDTINMGVLLARPNSRFLKLWQESFKHYTGKLYTYHAVEMVYKIYEEHPDLLVIEKRLQVMCYRSKCHPLWLDDYKSSSAHHEFDITKDAYSVHFTHPQPKEFKSEKVLKESEGFIASIGKRILE